MILRGTSSQIVSIPKKCTGFEKLNKSATINPLLTTCKVKIKIKINWKEKINKNSCTDKDSEQIVRGPKTTTKQEITNSGAI